MKHEKIACLGWGSLVWDPQGLPVRRPWFKDGPLLPIEFARQSDDKRITLVIVPDAPPEVARVRSLWALMSLNELEGAKKALADREGILPKNIREHVGFWSDTEPSEQDYAYADDIERWASQKDLDTVIWTALPPSFENKPGQETIADQVISFLKDLKERPYEKWKRAEEYIRKAPRQIDTECRRRIEMELGWSPIPKI